MHNSDHGKPILLVSSILYMSIKIIDQKEGDEEKKSEDDDLENIPPVSIATTLELEIVLRNQEISASPAIPVVRSMLLDKLHEYFGIVCGLPRPKSGRYEVFDTITAKPSEDGGEIRVETFENVVQLVRPEIVSEAYASIERHVRDASAFVDQWLAAGSIGKYTRNTLPLPLVLSHSTKPPCSSVNSATSDNPRPVP